MFSEAVSKSFREKLILLYLFEEAGLALSMGEIEEILLEQEILELFLISKNLGELVENGLIDEITDGEITLYRLNPIGSESLGAFRDKLNDYHRAKLDLSVNLFKRKRSKEKFINAGYRKVDSDETIVECEINENEKPLIKLELRVPSNEEAERICQSWNNKGVDLFQEILKILER